MTNQEMNSAVVDFCDVVFEHFSCDTCPIAVQCNACGGDFLDSTRDLDAAYEIVRNIAILPSVGNEVNHPAHYKTGRVECIDAMAAAFGKEAVKHFCLCNVFKYLYRYKNKGGQKDIEKAAWYQNKYIELLSGGIGESKVGEEYYTINPYGKVVPCRITKIVQKVGYDDDFKTRTEVEIDAEDFSSTVLLENMHKWLFRTKEEAEAYKENDNG